MKAAASAKKPIAWVTGLALVAGLALLLRPRNDGRADSTPPSTKSPAISFPARNSERPSTTPREASKRTSLTVDELVAIYEKEGADAALAAAKGLTGPDRDSQVVFILTYLARIDPEWVAKALAESGLSTTHQGFIVSAVMEHWKDGEKALAWASGFTGDLRKSAVGMALRILVRTDPEKALAYVDAMPDSGNRSQALTDLFASWGEHDPKAALAHLDHLSPDERVRTTELIAGAWARKSPREVIAWIGTVQDKATSDRLLQEVALNWSSVALDDAKAWIATLPDSLKAGILESIAERERNTIRCGDESTQPPPDQGWKNKPVAEMTETDLRNWGFQDPTGAKTYLERATGETDLSELATAVAAGMTAKETPAAIFEWAQSLDAKTGGNAALRLAIISWASTKPAEAADAIDQAAPERRLPLATALAETWSRNDPAAAAAWAASYPGNDQKTLVREVIQQWAGSEPREAYAWLATLPAGGSRDEGISYMLIRESSSDPASLVPWIELLSTPELQKEKRAVLDQDLKRAHGE
ncbi:hypothetical protein [Luteolibacter soli]|uniref:Uncharacterized protein n=1 Tax=Luteolibacter soli TaxID=3135280 RepID=A0ABU9AP82_9BACT